MSRIPHLDIGSCYERLLLEFDINMLFGSFDFSQIHNCQTLDVMYSQLRLPFIESGQIHANAIDFHLTYCCARQRREHNSS